MWTKRGRGGEGMLRRVRTKMMRERGCWCWPRMTTVQFQRKNCTKMHMAQRKCSSSYRGSCFIVMMWRGGLKNKRTLVMVFVVLRCWSKILKKETGSISRNPKGGAETVEKVVAKFFMRGWGKYHCTKNKLNLLRTNSIKKYNIIITYKMHLQQI